MGKVLRYAFIKTIPVLLGYLFLGIAFGVLLENSGYNFIWAFYISLFVYAGSMQFVMISFLDGGVNLFTIAVMTLLINSRHAFYGLSFIERFKKMGKAYPYMIFSLTDETYSLLCLEKTPSNLDENKVFLMIALLNHCYWIIGSILGALLGQYIPFNSKGIDFAMTALFVVIFMEQWQEYKTHIPALTGIGSGIFSLIVFGPDSFILPALLITVILLVVFKGYLIRDQKVEVVQCQ